jgi:hypothetical protein
MLGQLVNSGDSIAEMPLPIMPVAIWYLSKKPGPVGGYLTGRFFLATSQKGGFTGGFLFTGRFFIGCILEAVIHGRARGSAAFQGHRLRIHFLLSFHSLEDVY